MICDSLIEISILTCISGVHNKLGHLKGVSLHQAFAEHFHFAGIADLRLSHHDFEGAVSHMFAVLLHTHYMLTHFLRSEGDPWGENRKKMTPPQADHQWSIQFQ